MESWATDICLYLPCHCELSVICMVAARPGLIRRDTPIYITIILQPGSLKMLSDNNISGFTVFTESHIPVYSCKLIYHYSQIVKE